MDPSRAACGDRRHAGGPPVWRGHTASRRRGRGIFAAASCRFPPARPHAGRVDRVGGEYAWPREGLALELAELIAPATTAYVVVDVQNDYCRQATDVLQEFVDSAVARMAEILDAARETGVQVVHVQTAHGELDTSPTWRDRHDARSGGRPLPCRPGTPGADPYRLLPAAGEPVVVKHRYDGFIGTDLDVILRSRGIRTVVVVGVATDVCVDCTARHAFMLDYAVVMPRDAVASDSIEGHEHALRHIQRYFGHVVDAGEIVRTWRRGAQLAG